MHLPEQEKRIRQASLQTKSQLPITNAEDIERYLDGLDTECKRMLQELAEEYRFQILAMEVMLDRIHLLVDCRKQKQQKTEIQKRKLREMIVCRLHPVMA